ncbi:MAG: hypothetical protein QXP53_02180, partial [Candidatus Pacearchaeota archaeon]
KSEPVSQTSETKEGKEPPRDPKKETPSMTGGTKKTTKINWKRVGIVVAIIAFILVFIWPGKILLQGASVRTNYLNVSYSIFVDGQNFKQGSGSFQEGTLSDVLGFVSDKIDKEVARMQAGEEKNITLEAVDAFGACDSNKIYYYNRTEEVPREQEVNRTTEMDIATFEQIFGETAMLNKMYNVSLAPWQYKVIDVSNDTVKISAEAQVGQIIPSLYFSSKVVKVTEDKLTLRLEGNDSVIPSDNGNIEVKFTSDKVKFILTPELDQEVEFPGLPRSRVITLNETTITLTDNHKHCGKEVIVNFKLFSKEKQTQTTGSAIKHIEGAPTMQVFIMSHCPYGTQIIKGLLPVWQAFLDKANIELRFVSYTMHGAQEELDNKRIACVREEQSEKLLDYLKCFVYADGTEQGTQSCISKYLDKTKLDSCVESRAESYLQVDNQLNEQYGVRGSPTVIIDGQEASIYPRDPQSIANALCKAFKTKPSECSQAFSTENPSPGFGGGTSSSSGSGGSCG